MVEIRPMAYEDYSSVVNLWHEGWHHAHAHLVPKEVLTFRTKKYFWRWLDQSKGTFWIAADNDLLGFVSTNGSELVKLYVSAEARGKGVAAALLTHGEQEISANGFIQAVLFCTAGNSRAERFYKRQKWVLDHTFLDKLWLPKRAIGQFPVDTHCYKKALVSSDVSTSKNPIEQGGTHVI
ncbi:MAG: GNAT family N-acetyltransferase [Hyphomicrobiales bacterium]|nr:GNAT family N-acetyltransferase [Hyphomicrobiales bacterium]PCJ93194.1 MAG: GNAT family N-acetyltransferase [Hyphomicrobiales bacterium]